MGDLWGMVTIAETVLLSAVLLSQARLRIHLRLLGERTSTTAAQMREVVLEAQSLSAALAMRLAEPAGRAGEDDLEELRKERARAFAREGDGGTPPRTMVPTAWVPLVARGMAAVAEDPEADRAAARSRGMDPVGIAIQRRLAGRDTRPA